MRKEFVMKNKPASTEFKLEEDGGFASNRVWVSRDTEFDEAIDKEAREFLYELEKSKNSNRMIVGWRPD
jgi:hypothetical protein